MTEESIVTYTPSQIVQSTTMEEFLAVIPTKRVGLSVMGGFVDLVEWDSSSHQYNSKSYNSRSEMMTIQELISIVEKYQKLQKDDFFDL